MTEFADKLSALVALEMAAAHGDPDRQAEVLERLAHGVAFTISIMAQGSPAVAENLAMGCESYVAETLNNLFPVGKFMSQSDD